MNGAVPSLYNIHPCRTEICLAFTCTLPTQTRVSNVASSLNSAGTNYRGPTVGSGPGLVCVAYVFVFVGSIIICRLYKLTRVSLCNCNWQPALPI